MKKKLVFMFAVLGVILLFGSLVSAEIIFEKQPEDVYNLGDEMSVSTIVKATKDVSGIFYTQLVCEGNLKSLSQIPVSLETGQEKKVEFELKLNEDTIGLLRGECAIRAFLQGEESVTTKEFEISNVINVQLKSDVFEFSPGDNLIAKGNAFYRNGDEVNGFVMLNIATRNSTRIEQLDTINNGYFSVNVTIPNLAADNYLVQLNFYDTDSEGDEMNKGVVNYNIDVRQIPTNLEIVASDSVNPGTNLEIETILHDQTGERISTNSIITIKKSKNEIVSQVEVHTDEIFEFEIPYNEPPSNWTIFAVSNKLDSEKIFSIAENEEVLVEVENGTIFLTNKGNVLYNDSVLVKVGGNSSFEIDVLLGVDEIKKYSLNAPDGEYYVEIISEGESKFQNSVLLTGKSVDVRELRNSGFFVNPLVWFFVILVMGFVLFLVFKKGVRRSFFGKLHSKKKPEHVIKSSAKSENSNKSFIIPSRNRAKMSLSIKGDKQDISFVCLNVRNMDKLDKKGIGDTVLKIGKIAESKKAMVYESENHIFFIFSPLKTKTFKNEKAAIELSQKIENLLLGHNKIFKHKFDFGISLNDGSIVAKINEAGELEFMALGNIIANSKKLASLAREGIFLSPKFKDKAGSMIRVQDKEVEGHKIYMINEVRDREQHSKFISNFLHGLERDKKEKERREKK